MSVLEVKNIKKNFGKTEVLKGISFSLEKGEVLSIIGSSGSGKTTLLRCLNFLEFAESGTISVGGKIIYGLTVCTSGLYFSPSTFSRSTVCLKM